MRYRYMAEADDLLVALSQAAHDQEMAEARQRGLRRRLAKLSTDQLRTLDRATAEIAAQVDAHRRREAAWIHTTRSHVEAARGGGR